MRLFIDVIFKATLVLWTAFIVYVVLSILSSSAFGQDGIKLTGEPHKEYVEIHGTRQEGQLFAAGGPVKVKSRYGLRLSIGPNLKLSPDINVGALYAVAVLNTPCKFVCGSLYHEAELLTRYSYLGMSVGRRWDNGQGFLSSGPPEIGNSYFVRVSITFAVGEDK